MKIVSVGMLLSAISDGHQSLQCHLVGLWFVLRVHGYLKNVVAALVSIQGDDASSLSHNVLG